MYTTKTVDSQTTSPWIPLDDNQAAFNVSVAVAVTGTLTYTVQFTLDNIQDPSVTPVAFEVSSLTNKTADASTSLRSSVKAVRLNVTSYTSGSATIGVRQGTSWDGVDFAASSGPVTLLQSGIPFWIPPGDGGSNGLSLAADGTFTLSAESPMANAFNVLASGGYCYLPAGAGGLVTGGWFWCQMTDGTNGQVFQQTYPGTGKPAFVSSPTPFTGLTTGRITQLTSEITGPAFTMPGGSPGPNGIMAFLLKWLTSSTAGNKTVRCRAGSSSFFSTVSTTNNNDQLIRASRINIGVENRQVGNRTGTASGAWDAGSSATTYSNDVTTLNTAVDQTVSFSGQLAVNTDSIILVPMLFEVKYGG